MKKGIVIPCYNEEERLKLSEFQNFIDQEDNYILCFVNDGSKDGTLRVLEEFKMGQEDRVMVYNMPKNGGKAAAVRAGVKCLLEATDVAHIGFVDADLATGFNDYQRLVSKLENSDLKIVIGSRKIDEEAEVKRTVFRQLASYVFGKFIYSIIGLDIKDTQCGAKIFDRTIAQNVFNTPFQSKWLFDVEILIRIRNYFGKKRAMNYIKEIGLTQWEEIEGSKITLKDSLSFPLQLIQIGMEYNVMPQVKEINRVFKSSFLSQKAA